MEYFFGEHLRLDWGFENPNKTACLIACALVAVHGIKSLIKGRAGRVVFSIAFLGLGICLIHTYSRGGIVAALAGQSVYLVLVLREQRFKLEKRDWMWGAALSLFLIIYASIPTTNAVQRYSQGWFPGTEEDKSISNRLRIWKDVPRMMGDAPGGWGPGKSGLAWSRWYQPTDTRFSYRTLVNSHFTWLVELSWAGRIFYIVGWAAVLSICAVGGHLSASLRSSAAISTGVWVAFGIAAFFSSVADSWILWGLPVSVFLVRMALILKGKHQKVFSLKNSGASMALFSAPGILLLLSSLALRVVAPSTDVSIKKRGNSVVVGNPPNQFTLIHPDEKVLGRFFSFDIRAQSNSGGWEVIEEGTTPISNATETVIFSGALPPIDLAEIRKNAERIFILNPFNIPENLSGQFSTESIIVGKLRNDPVAKSLKRKYLMDASSAGRLISGRKNYLPNWVQIVQPSQPK